MRLRAVVEFDPTRPMRLQELKQIIKEIAASRSDILNPVFLSVEQVDDPKPKARKPR